MDRQCSKRENREHCTIQPTSPKMEGLLLVVFQQRRVSSMDMKHAVTVSYLDMSLRGKVRQQLTDVLQRAWSLKHISTLMDVRCRLKKKQLMFRAHSQRQFSKDILHVLHMEQGTVKSKQVNRRKWTAREELGESKGIVIACKSSALANIKFSEWHGRTVSGFYKWKM